MKIVEKGFVNFFFLIKNDSMWHLYIFEHFLILFVKYLKW